MYSKKNNYIYFKEWISDRVTIRELEYGDTNDMFELLSNPNVTKYLGFQTFDDILEARQLIEKARYQYANKEIFYLGIKHNSNSKIIGYIGLSRYDLSLTTCQVVYGLNEDYWGKGLMVDALKIFIDYLINIQKKKKIIATHIDVNVNSGKVMKKAGMLRDKSHDQDMVIKGRTEKLIGYSIIKE